MARIFRAIFTFAIVIFPICGKIIVTMYMLRSITF